MNEKSNNEYVKRTSKDYSMSFKLQVVKEVESGELSIYGALQINIVGVKVCKEFYRNKQSLAGIYNNTR